VLPERVLAARERKATLRCPAVFSIAAAPRFDAMLEDSAPSPRSTLAVIVRGAYGALDLAPQAAGLLAVSLGLSRVYADDAAMLEAAMPVYDALYAWCRDAQGEPHSWNYPS
jgi:hypothetical protein